MSINTSLSRGYAIHAEITQTLKEITENETAYTVTKYAQKFLTIATTLIYYSFTSVIFAGVSVWAFQAYVFGNATNVNGLLFTVALVISTPIGLALAKHSNFNAIAKARDLTTVIIRSLFLLGLLTGVWYEAISSSSNLQEKAFHAVENSNAGASILNTGVTIGSGSNESIAKAEFKLVACQRKMAEGSVKDCDNSKAVLKSLKEQAALDRKAVGEANAQAITAKQAALDNERDSHTLPAAKAISGWFGTSLAAGTFIVVIISSLFFELIHLSTVYSERNNLFKRDDLHRSLQGLKLEYFKATGKPFSKDDFKDDRVIDLTKDDLKPLTEESKEPYEIRTTGKPFQDKPDFGFIPSPSSAKFKWQESETKPTFGFVPERSYPQTIVLPTAIRGEYADTPRSHAKNPVKSCSTRLSVPARELSVPARETRTRESEEVFEPVYTRFSAIPTYEEGKCKWCGLDLSAYRKGTKFCKTDHKDKYWNLYKPSNKRFVRDV